MQRFSSEMNKRTVEGLQVLCKHYLQTSTKHVLLPKGKVVALQEQDYKKIIIMRFYTIFIVSLQWYIIVLLMCIHCPPPAQKSTHILSHTHRHTHTNKQISLHFILLCYYKRHPSTHPNKDWCQINSLRLMCVTH